MTTMIPHLPLTTTMIPHLPLTTTMIPHLPHDNNDPAPSPHDSNDPPPSPHDNINSSFNCLHVNKVAHTSPHTAICQYTHVFILKILFVRSRCCILVRLTHKLENYHHPHYHRHYILLLLFLLLVSQTNGRQRIPMVIESVLCTPP